MTHHSEGVIIASKGDAHAGNRDHAGILRDGLGANRLVDLLKGDEVGFFSNNLSQE
jgi:hypothetical protein